MFYCSHIYNLHAKVVVILFALLGFSACTSTQVSQNSTPTQQNRSAKTYNSAPTTTNTLKDGSSGLNLNLQDPPFVSSLAIIEKMSEGEQPGIQVNIPGVSAARAKADWARFMQQMGCDSEKRKGELFCDNVYFGLVSDTEVDVYAAFEDYTEGSVLKAFIYLGGAFLDERLHADQFKIAQNMLEDFAITESVLAMREMLEAAELNLVSLDVKRKELTNHKTQVHDDINTLEIGLARAKEDLARTDSDIHAANLQTKNQISEVEQLRLNIATLSEQHKTPLPPSVKRSSEIVD